MSRSESIAAWTQHLVVGIFLTLVAGRSFAATIEIFPSATLYCDEEFVDIANKLQPGDELVLHEGIYSQNCRRAISVNGAPGKPVAIRTASGARPLLTRPADNMNVHNNIEILNSSYLVLRGLRFRGGNIGVRFMGGHHITIEDCEIFETGNNAIAMNSGDSDSFVIRHNHIHHTGLSTAGPTEGEGMYIGCHDNSCRTIRSLIEGNYIHHLRATSDGGNDGIEVKPGSHGNIIRDNVIHDTNIGKQFPCISVYGGGDGVNIVEGNAVWNCGEGIQVVSDAIVRNNIVFNSSVTGITAAPHATIPHIRNVTIVNNTVVGHPTCFYIRWDKADNVTLANNAVYCPGTTAINASGLERISRTVRSNYVEGDLLGTEIDQLRFFDGGSVRSGFVNASERDFWPSPTSRLIGKADRELASTVDFNGKRRSAAQDVGAYETDGLQTNPGWKITSGFKEFIN